MDDYSFAFLSNRIKQEGKGLTPNQAKALLGIRDMEFQMVMAMMHTLSLLRAFMADDAPEYAKEQVRTVMDTNTGAIEIYNQMAGELTESRERILRLESALAKCYDRSDQ